MGRSLRKTAWAQHKRFLQLTLTKGDAGALGQRRGPATGGPPPSSRGREDLYKRKEGRERQGLPVRKTSASIEELEEMTLEAPSKKKSLSFEKIWVTDGFASGLG